MPKPLLNGSLGEIPSLADDHLDRYRISRRRFLRNASITAAAASFAWAGRSVGLPALALAGADKTYSGSVTLPDGFTVPAGQIWEFDANVSTTVEVSKNVIVEGVLRMRPSSSSVVHTLRFSDVDESAFVGGGSDPLDTDVGLWVVDAGSLDIAGTDKTAWGRPTAGIASGKSVFTMATAPAGWLKGDDLVIAPTESPGVGDRSWMGFESSTVSKVVGSTVTMTSSLSHAHPQVNGLWNPEVMNLTRNVNIEGTAGGRAHVHIHSTVPQVISNVQLRHVGPRQMGATAVEKILGRYGLHFHHGEDGNRGTIVKNVVVRDAGSHAFVPHISHGVTFENCIAYETQEDAYWWDEGDLTDDIAWTSCIAAATQYDPDRDAKTLTGFFLGRGSGNSCTGSVAVGVRGDRNASGFHWPSPANPTPNVWDIDANIAHNQKESGIFVWQNSAGAHVVSNMDVYNNGLFGINHGAYRNGYEYRDMHVYGNGEGALKLNAVSKDVPLQLSFIGVTFDAAGLSEHVVINAQHNDKTPTATPTLFQDCTFLGSTADAIGLTNEVGLPDDSLPDLIDFVDCNIDETDLTLIPDAHPDTVIRFQSGLDAVAVTPAGTTAIAPFADGGSGDELPIDDDWTAACGNK